jgi:hypothetical protein
MSDVPDLTLLSASFFLKAHFQAQKSTSKALNNAC